MERNSRGYSEMVLFVLIIYDSLIHFLNFGVKRKNIAIMKIVSLKLN